MSRIIFHIDVNSAYLSWTAIECLKAGETIDIREVASIIGGNKETRHGVVLAKSIEAKSYGICTGEPVTNALKKCPNLEVRKPDHKKYKEYSRLLMECLHNFTSDIEQVSIDECYLDFTGIAHLYQNPIEGAKAIKETVKKELGFTVNVGISTNKLLAKMASDFSKPDKIHTLYQAEVKEKMWPLPIEELHMAGKSSVASLKKLEVATIGDLANLDKNIVKLHLKSHGEMLWEFANGIGSDKVEKKDPKSKGIGNSTTLAEDVVEADEAKKVLLELSESVGRRLRKAEQKANSVSVEIKYYTFQTFSKQCQLQRATNEDKTIYEQACSLFDELWTKEPIRLLGIRTTKLQDEEEPEQVTLFDWIEEQLEQKKSGEKHSELNKALDGLRNKYGEQIIKRGSLLKESPSSRNT